MLNGRGATASNGVAGEASMHERPPTEPRYEVRRKLVVHQMRPATLFGRVLAFVIGVLILIAAFFVSLVIFSILLTATLFLMVYAWWVSRRVPPRDDHALD
jgi:flagellar biosynthesis protein FliP